MPANVAVWSLMVISFFTLKSREKPREDLLRHQYSGEVVCRNDFQAHVHSYESEEPQYFVLFYIKQLFCSVMIMFLLVLPNLKIIILLTTKC